jgi:hypothetical protein
VERPKQPLWRRVLLLAALVLASFNIWTGSPLVALWVGSKVQGSFTTLKTSAVAATVVVLAALSLLLTRVIAWLDVRYGEAVGRPPKKRVVRPWNRSVAGLHTAPKKEVEPLTAVERVLVAVVVIAVIAFEVWFFAFAQATIPNGYAV